MATIYNFKEIENKYNNEKVIAKDLLKIRDELVSTIETFNYEKDLKADGTLAKRFKDKLDAITDKIRTKEKRVSIRQKWCSVDIDFSYCNYNEADKNGYRSCYYSELRFGLMYIRDNKEVTKYKLEHIEDKYINIKLPSIKAKVKKVAKLLKQCEELQKEMPYYSKQQLPYVSDSLLV